MKRTTPLSIAILITSLTLGIFNSGAAGWKEAKFKRADKNKNGRIDPREFTHEKRREYRHKSKVNKPWERRADVNDDGTVSLYERNVVRGKRFLNNRSEVNRQWERNADVNKDGNIDKGELHHQYVITMDSNSDGLVDKKERKVYAIKRKSRVNTEIERKHDTNGNGYIDRDEARALVKDRLRMINTH